MGVEEKIKEHFSKYPKRVYPKNHILVFADEMPDHVYYIVTGKVRQYDVSYRGDEVIVNIFKPSAFFPMSWVINRHSNDFYYKTEEETEVHVVPPDDALEFLKNNPDVMLDLLSRLYRGVDGLQGRLVQLMSGTAKSRLLYELLIESRRFGKPLKDGSFELRLTEFDLAARAGLSRETINREIHKLKKAGIIDTASKIITVKDIKKIETLLGEED